MLKDGFVPSELTAGEASNRLQGRGVVQYQIAGETGPVNHARQRQEHTERDQNASRFAPSAGICGVRRFQ